MYTTTYSSIPLGDASMPSALAKTASRCASSHINDSFTLPLADILKYQLYTYFL